MFNHFSYVNEANMMQNKETLGTYEESKNDRRSSFDNDLEIPAAGGSDLDDPPI